MRYIGNYRLLAQIGRGGMGCVYKAADPEGKPVAVKVLSGAIADDPQARQRLCREAAMISRARTDGIAHICDFEESGDHPFIVTEFIDGPTLAEDIDEYGPLEREDLADLAGQLYQTLSDLHAQGILHRDIKPSNVMVTADATGARRYVVIDFGISQGIEDSRVTQLAHHAGTAGYIAPEVLDNDAPSAAGDWWAWAAVLLHCATGRAPFGVGSPAIVLQRVLAGKADVEGLDSDLRQLFSAALNPDPVRRARPEVVWEALRAGGDGGNPTVVLSGPPASADAGQTTVMAPPSAGATAVWPADAGSAPSTSAAAPATVLTPPVYAAPDAAPPVGWPGAAGVPVASAPVGEPPRHQWYQPYRPPREVATWFLTLPLMVILSAATLALGVMIPAGAALVLGLAGCGGRLIEGVLRRRAHLGYVAEGEKRRALIRLPGALVRTGLATAAACALGVGAAWGLWSLAQLLDPSASTMRSLLEGVQFPVELGESLRAQLWASLFIGYAVTWGMPWSEPARRAYRLGVSALAGNGIVRALLCLVLVAGAVALLHSIGVAGYLAHWVAHLV